MDPRTVEVYEGRAAEWQAQRTPRNTDLVRDRLVPRLPPEGPVVDLGCGPGWYAHPFGARAVAVDAARAMLDLVPDHAPLALRVQADLARLPFRPRSISAALGSKSYVHLPRSDVPMALAELHAALEPGAPALLIFFSGDLEYGPVSEESFDPRRRFSLWRIELLRDVLVGAGFEVTAIDQEHGYDIRVSVTRSRTLADTVAAGMRLLVCGLNPSVYAADAGVGFARPGNRFWPAALAAGLATRDRDPADLLRTHHIGMTDIVKRATPRADGLTTEEYRRGIARLERLVAWLQPGALCFVGLAGWRAAVDRRAAPGPQERQLGGRPVYVMPSTSGVNARSSVAALTEHLQEAVALAC